MLPYETFKLYRALKFHFYSDYDYFAAKGRIKNASPKAYEASPERYWAERLTKKWESKTPNFLLANLSEDKLHITALVNDESCDRRYRQWASRRNARAYHLKNVMKHLGDQEDECICDNSTLPKLYHRYIQGDIDKDSMAIIMRLTNCMEDWNEQMKDNPYWNNRKDKLVKYLPFIPVKSNFVTILVDKGWEVCYNSNGLVKHDQPPKTTKNV